MGAVLSAEELRVEQTEGKVKSIWKSSELIRAWDIWVGQKPYRLQWP